MGSTPSISRLNPVPAPDIPVEPPPILRDNLVQVVILEDPQRYNRYVVGTSVPRRSLVSRKLDRAYPYGLRELLRLADTPMSYTRS